MAKAALSPKKAVLTRIVKKLKKDKPALTGDQLVRQLKVRPAQLPIQAADVQGIVLRGYGALKECTYLLIAIRNPSRARAWLGALAGRIAPGVPSAQGSALQIAFTHAGLAALGLPADTLQGFSREFIAGMTDPEKSRFLGDEGESAPAKWQWGGPNSPALDGLLMVLADTRVRLDVLLDELRRGLPAGGLDEIRALETNPAMSSREHFGFADGISQPAIDGYHPAPGDLHRVKPGEFLLGYKNEYDLYTERPFVPAARDPFAHLPLDIEGSPRHDFGHNGTYLAFRQLRQHVPAFFGTLDALTRNPDGSPNTHARERLAAQMIGRWPSGTSLIEAPYADDVSKARDNEFRYHHGDRDGLKCPLGAHVRRVNPRDALAPKPGSDRSLAVNHRHRLIRRGRAYGPELPAGADDDQQERGLMFIALNANISRQFEFVQHSWILDPRFNGFSGAADPIVGALPNNQFVAPADPVRARALGLPRFVTVAGGAYFFMPGIRALRFLARLAPDE